MGKNIFPRLHFFHIVFLECMSENAWNSGILISTKAWLNKGMSYIGIPCGEWNHIDLHKE